MKRITIGYLDPFRPFCWADGGQARGRFVAALRDKLPEGVAVDWVPGPFEALPAWLASGRIEAIAAKAITPGRSAEFGFSRPLLHTAAALFGAPGRAAPHPAEAGTARIATPAAGPLAGLLPGLAPMALVVAVADYAAALQAVADGTADWAALNADVTPAQFPGRTGPAGPRWAPLGLAVAVAPGDRGGALARLGLEPHFPGGK